MKKIKKLLSFALALALVVTLLPANVTKAADTAPIGIDVSWEAGEIDWSLAKEDIDFAVIRAIEGTMVDDEFLNNVAGCEANEVPYGVSVYTLAQTADEAVAEAEIALELLDGYTPTLPIYMEFEDADLYALSEEEKMAVVNAFAETVEAAGYEAGLYVTLDTYNAYFAGKVDALKIWVSDLDATSLPLANADMWQYTWEETVAGVDVDASMNYYYGDKIEAEHVCTPVVVPGKDATCTEAGLTEGSVCSDPECGKVLVEQKEIPALGHKAGEEVHENVQDGVSYDKVVRCSVCKEEISRETISLVDTTLRLSGATLKLENDITVIMQSKFVGTYNNPYLMVTQTLDKGETKVTRVDGEWVAEENVYKFFYKGVEAKQVVDTFVSQIFAYDDNGYVVQGQTSTPYGAKVYCNQMLSKSSQTGMSTAKFKQLKVLLVDLLNYASAAQVYFQNYKVDTLANADLTDTQKALASSDDVLSTLVSLQDTRYEVIDSPKAAFRGAGLSLLNKVYVFVQIQYTGDVKDLTAVFTLEDGTSYEVTEFTKVADNRYQVQCDQVTAFQFEDAIYIKIMEGDTVVSNTARYSVGTYALAKLNDTNVGPVVGAMMKYGKSAAKYMITP